MLKKPYRRAAVAGAFYPANRETLQGALDALFKEAVSERQFRGVVAAMSPHAGIIYSGRVAASVFSSIEIPNSVVILAPNHTGLGARGATIAEGLWESPLGDVEIDSKLARRLIKASEGALEEDETAHYREHSIEVIVPFLQYRNPKAKIVPIVLSSLSSSECVALGERLAEATEGESEVLFVASSDMTHFETKQECKRKDEKAIERMLALDPLGLYDTVRKDRISMCGVIPATVITALAAKRGDIKTALVDYDHSSRKTHEGDDGVAYAGAVFYKEEASSETKNEEG